MGCRHCLWQFYLLHHSTGPLIMIIIIIIIIILFKIFIFFFFLESQSYRESFHLKLEPQIDA